MERNTGTHFKIYLADKTRRGLEEGFIRIWQHKGKRITDAKSIPFDRLDEIPDRIRQALNERGIDWPAPQAARHV
jgi:hypothetical protein